MRTNKHQTAGLEAHARKGAVIGTTDKIREALDWRKGKTPKTIAELAVLTGVSEKKVKTMVSAMVGFMGGMVAIDTKRSSSGCRYALFDSPEARQALHVETNPSRVAGRITIGRGHKWGAGA